MKKNTKLLLLGVIALFSASCSEMELINDFISPGRPVSLQASIETSNTRASIEDGSIVWQADDAIAVRLTSGGNLQMILNENSVGKTSAVFDGILTGGATISYPTVGVYPYNENHVLTDGNITINMPATYTVASTANTNMVMKGVYTSEKSGAVYKHLGGVMQFVFKNVPAGARKFRFTAKDNQNITGNFSITQDASDNDIIAATEGDGSRSSVTIEFKADQIVDKTLTVNVPLPVGTYKGMKLDILDAEGNKLINTITSGATNSVKRAKRLLMPEITLISLGGDTETDYTADDVTAALNSGKNITINNEIEKIDLTEVTATGDATIVLSAAVGEIVLANETDNNITINVAKDVDYPALSVKSGKALKNISIIGDPTSSKSLSSGINTLNTGVAVVENVLIDGVRFTEKGISVGYSANPQTTYDITIQNCVAENMKEIFFTLAHNSYAGTKVGNITIKNNQITYASDAASNTNGINIRFATEGTILIENNTITNAKYHGIMMENNAGQTIIRNNTISAIKDGVKMDYPAGSVTVTGNNIKAKEHIIRFARFKAANNPSLTITGNTLDVSEMGYVAGEAFYGICFGTSDVKPGATATIVVKENVKEGTVTNHNAWFYSNPALTLNSGSDIATPYVVPTFNTIEELAAASTTTYDEFSNNVEFTYYDDKTCTDKGNNQGVMWVKSVTLKGLTFGEMTDGSATMSALAKVIDNHRRRDTGEQFKNSIVVNFEDCTFSQSTATFQVYKVKPVEVTDYNFKNCEISQTATGQYALTLNVNETSFHRGISYSFDGCTITSAGRGINIIPGTETESLEVADIKVVFKNNTFTLPTSSDDNMALQIAGNWDAAYLSAAGSELIEFTGNDVTAYCVVRVNNGMKNNTTDSAKYILKASGNTLATGTLGAVTKSSDTNETTTAIATAYNSLF